LPWYVSDWVREMTRAVRVARLIAERAPHAKPW
jgi:hypothetical protein